uniref:OBERON-like protein n=1 Tax=Kalanchoe fedtschenkoi TaxID=63787 RepID=A0A7N0VCR6_KALFE
MMAASSDSNVRTQPSPRMLPPRQHPRPGALQTSLSLVASDSRGPLEPLDPRSNSDNHHESPTESASSRETWPTADAVIAKKLDSDKAENDRTEHSVMRRASKPDKISLRDIARERVDFIAEKMSNVPDETLEDLKNGLRLILEGNGGSHHRDEFLTLQKFIQSRTDLTANNLMRAHRAQLEIIVSINTGIQGFLHPNISLSQKSLIEVFMYKRCRNIACFNTLPAEDCNCGVCTNRSGFCSLCMCVICNKFDFEVNTCRWIGCDLCSHWTHTDCAIRDGLICMGPTGKTGTGQAEMLFRCRACNATSELLGWVKDVFQHCAPVWDREALIRELDFVCRIFRSSQDSRGRKLFWKSEDIIEKLKGGVAESMACRVILMFFQELEMESPKNQEVGENGHPIAPQEACNRIAEVVQEAIRKMEMVADEKMRMLKKARLSLEACERELEDKAREVNELKQDRNRKKQQLDELDSLARLKQAEADMFQLKANDARRESERLQRIALAKSDKSEEDYASNYLKLRLSEAEAEKQYLLEMIKLQETSRAAAAAAHSSVNVGSSSDPSQAAMYSKIQDIIKNVYNASPSQRNESQSMRPNP